MHMCDLLLPTHGLCLEVSKRPPKISFNFTYNTGLAVHVYALKSSRETILFLTQAFFLNELTNCTNFNGIVHGNGYSNIRVSSPVWFIPWSRG